MALYAKYIKRFLDLSFSVILFVLLFPVLLLITACLFVVNNGKPFFTQKRVGRNGRIFLLVKFKTMNDKKDEQGNLLPDEKRMTGPGKFVRKYSIDELPQLLNVIMGNMSLIGPRPLLVQYLPLYTPRQNRRHEVKPGITGWAQVNGRNALSWEEKFELDVWYVDHVSFRNDLRILTMTVAKTVKADGISNEGHATMPYFKGAE